MSYQQPEGGISLFPNDKGDNERRPDWRGDAMIDGKKYRVSMWTKQGAKGAFLSGKVEPDQKVQDGPFTYESPRSTSQPRAPKPERGHNGGPDLDDSLPF